MLFIFVLFRLTAHQRVINLGVFLAQRLSLVDQTCARSIHLLNQYSACICGDERRYRVMLVSSPVSLLHMLGELSLLFRPQGQRDVRLADFVEFLMALRLLYARFCFHGDFGRDMFVGGRPQGYFVSGAIIGPDRGD